MSDRPTLFRIAPHLTRDARRRDDLPYATPQELLALWKRDPGELMHRFEQVLGHVWEILRLRPSDLQLCPSDLQLPIQLGPFNPAIDPLSGELGFACLVLPPTESYSKETGDFRVYSVPTPSLPS